MQRKKLSYTPIEGTLALLDGDILCYRIGFTTQDVNENICLSRINSYLDNILFDSGASDYVVFLTGENNYRKLIYPEYKANRTQEKPKHYNLIREYLMNHEAAMLCEDEEADDAMGYNQMLNYDVEEDIYKSIICSSDKDLKQAPGRHYDFTKGNFSFVTPEEGKYFFYQQLLTGDRVDNIPGLPKVGPVTAKKILGEISDEAIYKEKVLAAYMEVLSLTEEQAKEKINLIGKLVYIRQKPNEMWQF
jgi:5'-3' exonuclease